MEAYTDFAYLYDIFMEDVPYEEWSKLLTSLVKMYGDEVKNIVDLGCGTGTITRLLAQSGYDVTGVDISPDMLAVANEKTIEEGLDILYLNQDMSELSMLDEVDAFISVCDSINYLILDEDILNCFKGVRFNLKKNGIFIFDFNTIYKYETVIGDTTIAENREECSFIWDNYYNPEDHINEYDVTFFVKEKDNDELFRRFSEVHIQRGYSLEEIKEFLERADLRFVTALDEETHKTPTDKSERIYVVARA